MVRHIIWLIIIFLSFEIIPCFSQEQYDDITDLEVYSKKMTPVDLIDNPTANIIPRRRFEMKLRVYHLGGILGSIQVAVTPRMMFGVSYGGQNVIGQGEIQWNKAPGVNVRYRLKFEDLLLPAISLGFDSQGYGTYYADEDRYQIKAKGFYLSGSKNFFLIKDLGIHGGVNFSSENKGPENDLNFFVGAHLMLDQDITLLWEYDFGINDNDTTSLGAGKGYMNVAIQWHFSREISFEFSFKNLLRNIRPEEGESDPNSMRELKVIYYMML